MDVEKPCRFNGGIVDREGKGNAQVLSYIQDPETLPHKNMKHLRSMLVRYVYVVQLSSCYKIHDQSVQSPIQTTNTVNITLVT